MQFAIASALRARQRSLACNVRRAIRLIASIVVVLIAERGHSQDHANVARGFKADGVYQMGEVDSISTFSGNLNLSIPIGQEYRVGGNLSYALKLVYNGQMFAYRQFSCPDCQIPTWSDAVPGSQSNVALGWQLSLGEIRAPKWTPPGMQWSPPGAWAFYTPDGSKHTFYKVLHPDQLASPIEAPADGPRRNVPAPPLNWLGVDTKLIGYTRDSTYMRLLGAVTRALDLPGTQYVAWVVVELPNGTSYLFRTTPTFAEIKEPPVDRPYYLHAIADVFGNKLHLSYLYREGAQLVENPHRDGDKADRLKIAEMRADGSAGREHEIEFADEQWYQTKTGSSSGPDDPNALAGGEIVSRKVIKKVRVAASGGVAEYTFNGQWTNIVEPCDAFLGFRNRRMNVRLLTSIEGPEGFTYTLANETGPSGDFDCSMTGGHITGLQLPTGATIRYGLDRRWFPSTPPADEDPRALCGAWGEVKCADAIRMPPIPGSDYRPPYLDPVAVRTRIVDDPITGQVTTHRYTASTRCLETHQHPKPQEMMVFTDAPGGTRTVDYFSIDYNDAEGGDYPATVDEYALPYSKNLSLSWAPGYFLSTEVMSSACSPFPTSECGGTNACDDRVMRRTYVKYEIEPSISSAPFDQPGEGRTDLNRRLAGTITITRKLTRVQENGQTVDRYVDETCFDGKPCHSKVEYSDFDGLGHYRKDTKTSNVIDRAAEVVARRELSRIVRTDYVQAIPLPSDAGPWQLGLYRGTHVKDGTAAEVQLSEVCWNPKGFMTHNRIFRGVPDGPDSHDLLSVFEVDTNGNVKTEKRFAVAPSSGTDCNNSSPGSPVVAITNVWAHGALKSSQYEGVSFKSPDFDIDPNTGLATKARDEKGRDIAYCYDKRGRLKRGMPILAGKVVDCNATASAGSGIEADAELVYSMPILGPSQRPASVLFKRTLPSKPGSLIESRYYYDGLGRLIQEKRRMPAGWATISHSYDAEGRKAAVTSAEYTATPEYSAPTATTPRTKYSYDPLGRATRIVAPSGEETRPGDLTDDGSVVEISYTGDWEVSRQTKVASTPGDIANQKPVINKQFFDGFGRLYEVVEDLPGGFQSTKYKYDFGDRLTSVVNGQTRTFVYDRSGLLLQEDHPEQELSRYTYDGAGRLRTKQIGDDVSLTHSYDAAGRLKEVFDEKTGKRVSEFKFDFDEGVDEPGRLLRRIRHNYFPDVEYVVTDRLRYEPSTGWLLSKQTEVSSVKPDGTTGIAREAKQTHTYDEIGQPRLLSFPECLQCVNFPLGKRELALNWRDGTLLGIAGVASGFEYTASGTVTRLLHDNGVTDEYQQHRGMARPTFIKFSGVRECGVILRQPANPDVLLAGASATFSIELIPGATVQWFEGIAGDISRPIAGASATTYTTPPLAETKSYWAQVRAAGGSCSQESLTVKAVVCTAPVIRTPAATSAVEIVTNSERTISIDVAGAVTYQWYTKVGTDGVMVPVADAGSTFQITFKPTTATPAGSPLAVIAVVNSPCADPIAHTVALFDVVDAPRCSAVFDAPLTNVTPWNHTVMPKELTDMTVTLKPPPFPKVRYSYRWYEDGVLRQSVDKASPADTDAAKNSYPFRFVGQAHLRVEAWVSCFSNAADTSPYADSEHISKESYGVQNGHCPTPDVSVSPVDAVLVLNVPSGIEQAELKARSLYPAARYQWYRGESGNTKDIASDDDTATFIAKSVGTYWVRVFSLCGNYVDSETMTVSDGSCHPVRILRDPAGREVEAATPVTLSVDATGVPATGYYIWREARNAPGSLDRALAGSNGKQAIIVAPLETTDYYARVGNGTNDAKNDCSISDSRIARIRVTSCKDITIVAQPQDVTLGAQDASLALAVQAISPTSSTPLQYQWFQGYSGDMSKPVDPLIGSGTTLRLTWQEHLQDPAARHFWVKVSFDILPGAPKRCAVDSRTVTICRLPRVHNPLSANYSNSLPGVRRSLGIGVTGDDVLYQWYEGDGNAAVPDESQPLGSRSNAVYVWPTRTTKYWVKIWSACGPAGQWTKQTTEISVCPAFSGPPTADRTLVTPNTTTTLHVSVERGDRIEWYEHPVGGEPRLVPTMTGLNPVTPNITASTRFFARAYSGICTTDSPKVTINLCSVPNVHWSHGSATDVARAESFWLTAGLALGETATWQWYQGTPGNEKSTFTRFHTSSNTVQVPGLQSATSYWVRATDQATGCYSDTPIRTVRVCSPTIAEQPKPVMINSGDEATLTVKTDDLPGVTYQWYQGPRGDTSVKLVGQTFNVLKVTLTTNATYWVRALGCDNTKWQDSDAVTVSICVAPKIIQQPQHRVLAATGSAEIKVVAEGTELTYQWYKGPSGDTSNPIPNATTPIRTQDPAYTTKYWVRVSGRCGSIDSAAASLARPPIIQTQPENGKAITKGTTTQLSVVAAGNELSYQWYQRTATGDVAVSLARAATLTTPPIYTDTTFFCRIWSGSHDTAIAVKDSADATVKVCQSNTFTVNQTDDVSQSAVYMSIDGAVSGETYDWYTGAAGDILQSSHVWRGSTYTAYPLETTYYWVRTTRAGCYADSEATRVTVCRPKITSHPVSVTIPAGTSTTLSAGATGTGALSYQWYKNGSYLNGATGPTHNTGPLDATTTYSVRVTSSSTCSTRWTDSAVATVTVCQPPKITDQDTIKRPLYNSSVTLQITATGDNLLYQWYEGGVGDTSKPVGTSSRQYTFTAIATKYYWVRVSGTCGSAMSSQAIYVSVPPNMTAQPATATVCGLPGTAEFAVAASNVERYQWYRQYSGQAAEMIGGNSASLQIAISQVGGEFWVVLTSGLETVTSAKATVVNRPMPTVNGFRADYESSGDRYKLTVTGSGLDDDALRFNFYQGPIGDTSMLLGTVDYQFFYVRPPTKPIKYWVRVFYPNSKCYIDREVTIQ